MRGNLIWVVGLSGSNVEFMLDESGEWEVVDGGRITQHQNEKQDSRQLKNRCDVCGEPSTHQAYSGIKGEMAFCCKHHIERGGIPADWHPQCLKYYKEKTESPQAKQSQVESNPEFLITSFRNKNDHEIIYKHDSQLKNIYCTVGSTRFFYAENLLSIPEYEIYSVKRLSDEIEFTIQEETNYGTIGLFFIKDGKMMIQQDKTIGKGFGGVPIGSLTKKESQILFTTDDGVKIYDVSERYYVVITKEGFGYEPYSVALLAHGDVYDANYKDACRVFSTKEKAEEYILLNKPVLSLKDIDDLVDDENAWEKAKQIAKEKMKA